MSGTEAPLVTACDGARKPLRRGPEPGHPRQRADEGLPGHTFLHTLVVNYNRVLGYVMTGTARRSWVAARGGVPAALFCCVLVAGLLGACAQGMHVDKVALSEPAWPDPAAVLAPIRFDKAVVALQRGRRIGSYRDGLECATGGQDLWWNTGARMTKDIDWNALFHEQMTIGGHTVLGDPGAPFEGRVRDRARPAYLVSARIEDIRLNLCEAMSLWTAELLGAQLGEGSVRVYWQVFSVVERKVVLEASTAGYHALARPVGDGPVVLVMEAFAQAAANFAADPGLIALVSNPAPTREAVLRAKVGDRQWLPAVPPFDDGLLPNIDTIRQAVVTLDNGEDRATGVYVAPDLVLTTRAAVQGTDMVRLTLTTGRSVLGSVLRWHEARDVALVQVEKTGVRPLPLRTEPAGEAMDVYALGTPAGPGGRRATVTRGVVGRLAQAGTGLPVILADMGDVAGLAGAPLLDADGAVVGIGTLPRGEDGTLRTAGGGLTAFVPIAEALDALALRRRHPNDTREEDAAPEPVGENNAPKPEVAL